MGDDKELKYWIWLQSVLGTASPIANTILESGISPEYIFKNIDSIPFFTSATKKKAKATDLSVAECIVERCEKENIGLLCPNSNLYPKSLLNIFDPPLMLYFKGKMPDFNSTPSICVVGPRKISDYGYKCAYSLSARLAIAGFIVVSGGAVGGDYASHDAVLIHKGITVAVLGNGFGADYLAKNKKLRERIEENGCLITEYPPDTPASKYTFPKRNRLMAAITNGTVLIEAPQKSGTLITAGYAAEYSKDLFVIPGAPGNINYQGSNLLLRDGAKPLLEISDIFSEYLWDYSDKIDIEKAYNATIIKPVLFKYDSNNESKTSKNGVDNNKNNVKCTDSEKITEISKKILPEHLSKNAKIVYNQLDKQKFCCDDLLGSELNSAEIMSALGELEIYGFIVALPGGRYSLK